MNGINRYLAENKDIQSIISGIESGMKEQLIAGLSGSARSLLVANIQQALDRPLLFITHQLNQAEQLYDDLSGLVDESLVRSEEHTSELQSRFDLVCRLLLEKKKQKHIS